MSRPRFILAAFCSAALGILLAVLTNQGTYTPTAAYPALRKEARWNRPPTPTTEPTTPPWSTHTATPGNTAIPTVTTHHPKDPTTTAPSTSTNQTATTGTSTPDPTTTTNSPTTSTEGATVTTTQTSTPPPPDESTAQSIATDVQGIGLPPQPQRTLEGVQ